MPTSDAELPKEGLRALDLTSLHSHNDTFLLIAISATAVGFGMALCIVGDASMRGQRPTAAGGLLILIAGGNLSTGLLIAWVAWRLSFHEALVETGHHLQMQIAAILYASASAASVLVALLALCCSIDSLRDCIDSTRFHRYRLRNTVVLSLSPTNLELLRVVPWHENAFDELPTRLIFVASMVQPLVEDVLRIIASVLFITLTQKQPSLAPSASLSLAVAACSFSVFSVCTRCARKLLAGSCASQPPASRRRPYWVRDPTRGHKRRQRKSEITTSGVQGGSTTSLPARGIALRWLSEEESVISVDYRL